LRDAARRLLDHAQSLVEERGLTLIGVSVSNLSDADAVQLPLPFDHGQAAALDHALDGVRDRFGSSAVGRAALLGKDRGWSMPLLPDG
jgi:DNA polymerase-4